MIDLLRYTLSTSSTHNFLPSIPSLTNVRRLALQESCRDILLSSVSASASIPTERAATERWIADVIEKAISSSPTLSDEERREVERKISEGRWDELLLDNTTNSTDAAETGRSVDLDAIAGLEGLLRMIHSILTHSRAVWRLSPSDRRDFVADALFDDSDEDENCEEVKQHRQLFLNQFASAVDEILDDMEFEDSRKSEIVNDISATDYVSLLLPSRFDCEERTDDEYQDDTLFTGNALSAMSAARIAQRQSTKEIHTGFANNTPPTPPPPPGVETKGSSRKESLCLNDVFILDECSSRSLGSDYHQSPRSYNMPQTLTKSADLAAFANVSRKTARDALDKTGDNTEDAAVALLDFVASCTTNNTHASELMKTDSMNLAEVTGTTRHCARDVIDNVGGDLDKAADVLLTLMLDKNNNADPTTPQLQQQLHPSGRALQRLSYFGSSCSRISEEKEVQTKSLPVPTISETERLNQVHDPLNTGSYRILSGCKEAQSEEKTETEEVSHRICPICFVELEKNTNSSKSMTRTLRCGHSFCNPCVRAWVGKKGVPFPCPVCRARIGFMSYRLKPWLKKSLKKSAE